MRFSRFFTIGAVLASFIGISACSNENGEEKLSSKRADITATCEAMTKKHGKLRLMESKYYGGDCACLILSATKDMTDVEMNYLNDLLPPYFEAAKINHPPRGADILKWKEIEKRLGELRIEISDVAKKYSFDSELVDFTHRKIRKGIKNCDKEA